MKTASLSTAKRFAQAFDLYAKILAASRARVDRMTKAERLALEKRTRASRRAR